MRNRTCCLLQRQQILWRMRIPPRSVWWSGSDLSTARYRSSQGLMRPLPCTKGRAAISFTLPQDLAHDGVLISRPTVAHRLHWRRKRQGFHVHCHPFRVPFAVQAQPACDMFEPLNGRGEIKRWRAAVNESFSDSQFSLRQAVALESSSTLLPPSQPPGGSLASFQAKLFSTWEVNFHFTHLSNEDRPDLGEYMACLIASL